MSSNISKRRSLVAILVSLCIILTTTFGCDWPDPPPSPIPDPTPIHTEAIDMTVSVIDVGQGDSILIQSEGQTLLIDAGKVGAGAKVVAYLKAQGITKIDYLVATHPDADHIGGIEAVLKDYDVAEAIFAPALASNTKTYSNFIEAIEDEPNGIALTTPQAGTEYPLGDATIEVLANGDGAKTGDTNSASIVLKVICGGKSILLTGDAADDVEKKLMAEGAALDSDVLKVGHHGSKTATSKDFLEVVTPEYAVISCGLNNSYGHPTQDVLDRLQAVNATTYRTDLDGTVVLLFSDGAIARKAA